MSLRRALLIMLPLLVISLIVSPGLVQRTQATLTGLVCLQDPSSSGVANGKPCSTTAATFDGPAQGPLQALPTQIRIGVYVNNSDSLNGFDITLLSNHTVIRPTGVDYTGTVLPGTPTVVIECLGSVKVTGPCSTRDTVDALHLGLLAGFNQATTAPTTGLLFTAIYNITGTAPPSGVSVGFQTGCSGTSDSPFCVTVSAGATSTPLPENIQAASFNNFAAPPWVLISSNATILSFTSGSAIGDHVSMIATAENLWPGSSLDSIFFLIPSSTGLTGSFSPVSCATHGSSCSVVLTLAGAAGTYSLIVYGRYVLKDASFSGQTDTLSGPVSMTVIVSASPLSSGTGGNGGGRPPQQA